MRAAGTGSRRLERPAATSDSFTSVQGGPSRHCHCWHHWHWHWQEMPTDAPRHMLDARRLVRAQLQATLDSGLPIQLPDPSDAQQQSVMFPPEAVEIISEAEPGEAQQAMIRASRRETAPCSMRHALFYIGNADRSASITA